MVIDLQLMNILSDQPPLCLNSGYLKWRFRPSDPCNASNKEENVELNENNKKIHLNMKNAIGYVNVI